jgi:hypothetical protein
MINEQDWKKEYKRLCCDLLGMSTGEAEIHFQAAPDFDFGYNPRWYLREELNCNFIKKKG